MYIQVYRYSFVKKNYVKWLRITQAANRIYIKYGIKTFQRWVLTKKSSRMYVMETGTYTSKERFVALRAKAGQDKELIRLYHQFTTIVNEKDIIEEIYESV